MTVGSETDPLPGSIFQAALEYAAAMNWRVVPLHWSVSPGVCSCHKGAKCPTPGKHPYGKDWQKRATFDAERIEQFWRAHPLANVGIQMGEASKLIDFETDDAEQEKILLDLFDENLPVTTTFTSYRGKHRLFLWRPDLPGGSIVRVGALVVRIGNDNLGAMSVFPPSVHPEGSVYKWLVHPGDCPPQPLPDKVMAKLWNLSGVSEPNAADRRSMEHWEKILAGVPEGCRDSSMISYIGKLLRGVIDLDDKTAMAVLYKSVEAVNARNQPPLPDEALRKDFLNILKAEQNRRAREEAEGVMPMPPENQVEKAQAEVAGKPTDPGTFKLVIVESDPPSYELHASHFSRAKDGYIVLTAEQMNSPSAIRVQALKQAEYPMPKGFDKAWGRKGGLYEKLIFTAEHKAAPLEEKRYLVVADRLQTRLLKAREVEEGAEVDDRGRPQILPDGSVMFLFNAVWEEMNFGADKVTRLELSRILRDIGAVAYQTKGVRFKKLTKEALQKLAMLVEEDG